MAPKNLKVTIPNQKRKEAESDEDTESYLLPSKQKGKAEPARATVASVKATGKTGGRLPSNDDHKKSSEKSRPQRKAKVNYAEGEDVQVN